MCVGLSMGVCGLQMVFEKILKDCLVGIRILEKASLGSEAPAEIGVRSSGVLRFSAIWRLEEEGGHTTVGPTAIQLFYMF